MKKVVIFLGFAMLATGFAFGEDFKGIRSPLLGVKMQVTEDNRPGGPALGKTGTVTEIERADWLVFDLEKGGKPKAVRGDLPAGYKEWDPNTDLPENQTKIAVLIGRIVITLEDGTKILDDDSLNGKCVSKDEEQTAIQQITGMMTKIQLAVFVAIKQPPDSEPEEELLLEPELKTTLGLGSTDYKWGLKTLDGNVFNSSSAKGKVVLVNIWATWCGWCIREMPSLQKLYAQIKDKVVFLFVTEEDAETVKQWLAENKEFTMPVYLVKPRNMPKYFQTDGIPATFIIAPGGKIVLKHVGAAKWDGEKTVNFLRSLVPKRRVKTYPAKPVRK